MGDGTLRVLTWNVRNHLGDPLAVHRVLRGARPDVACLQEVTRWPFSRHRLASLGRACGLRLVCGGRASAGAALLVGARPGFRGASATRLDVRGLFTRPRGLASVLVALPGTEPVWVASVHLGLNEAERAMHVAAILAAAPSGPAVVAGDLNEPPGGPSWVALATRFADAGAGSGPTFPAAHPRTRIDAVLADPGLEVVAAGWPDGVDERDVAAASDHLPLLVTLRLRVS